MAAARVVDTAEELDFDVRAMPLRPKRSRLILADPEHYGIEYVINPFMAGNVGAVDLQRARKQWHALRGVFEDLGFPVSVVPAAVGLPDLVFAANQSFPAHLPDGSPVVVLSRMASPHRHPEVAHFEAWYRAQGVRVLHLPRPAVPFEGMGDGEWLPGHRVIFAGHGFRSHPSAWSALALLLDVPVLRLRLIDERFYHLDTCLQLLDAHTALVVEEAFAPDSLALLRAAIPNLLPVPVEEASRGFACNGYSPDRRHFVMHHGNWRTRSLLRAEGFDVVEVDTSEFLRSGGSVYCMKLHLHGTPAEGGQDVTVTRSITR